jgi:hypothetical protein
MAAGGYCVEAQAQWGKKGRLERGSKMLCTINDVARQGVNERLEGGMICAHHYPSVFPLFIPQAQLAASQCSLAVVRTSPQPTWPQQCDWFT